MCGSSIPAMPEQNMQGSCAFHPPRCLGMPRIFLTHHTRLPLLASTTARVRRVCTPENSQPAPLELRGRRMLALQLLQFRVDRAQTPLTGHLLPPPHHEGTPQAAGAPLATGGVL
jgi:hypothetical protein